MTEMKLFVYGSMSEGLVHYSKIKNFVTESVSGHIIGSTFRLKHGFPVVVLKGQDSISGSLLTISAPDLLLGLLDEFHGFNLLDEERSLFLRKKVLVNLVEETSEAWLYAYNPLKLGKDAVLIEGGNWQESMKQHPSITDKLTEKQKASIVKLGTSSGREMVPLDHSTYRELLILEIIVDKGRRFALSKFGNEVFKYLE